MPDAHPQSIAPDAIPIGYEPVVGPESEDEAIAHFYSFRRMHGPRVLLVRKGECFWVWVEYRLFWID